ncbi:MAG: VTT domain-containing protein [Erysipelotrichaceae bacterium]|nr:VTT domain-containing protein [Erysipelotrichaceae bacterium]
MTKKKKRLRLKRDHTTFILLTLIILVVLAVLTFVVHTIVDNWNSLAEVFELLRRGNEAEIEAYLRASGLWKGMFLIALLTVIQVFSIVLPGMVIHLAAGSIYGWWEGFLVCYVSFVFAHYLVFKFGRRLSDKLNLMNRFAAAKSMQKRLDSSEPMFVIAMAYLVPGVPNGIIPYVASHSKLTTNEFMISLTTTVWVQVLLNCIAGHFLVRGEYFFTVLSFVIQFLVIAWAGRRKGRIMKFYHRFQKSKGRKVRRQKIRQTA